MRWLEFSDALGQCNTYSDWNRMDCVEVKEKPSTGMHFRAIHRVIMVAALNHLGFKVSPDCQDHRSIKNQVKDTFGMDVRYP